MLLYYDCMNCFHFRKKWINIIGIGKSTYYRTLKDINSGIVNKERFSGLSRGNSRGNRNTYHKFSGHFFTFNVSEFENMLIQNKN